MKILNLKKAELLSIAKLTIFKLIMENIMRVNIDLNSKKSFFYCKLSFDQVNNL